MRWGEYLEPLACVSRDGQWMSGAACLRTPAPAYAVLAPLPAGKGSALPVLEGSFYDEGGDQTVKALALANPATPGRPEYGPLAGLGTTGGAVDLRLTESWARELHACGPSTRPCPSQLPIVIDSARRAPSARQKDVASALAKLGLPARCRWKVTQDVLVRIADGGWLAWRNVHVDVGSCGEEAQGLAEAGDLTCAFAAEGAQWRQIPISRSGSRGMKEGGAVLAIMDLDRDGTDEVLLKWTHDDGAWYVLVRPDTRGGYSEVGRIGTGT